MDKVCQAYKDYPLPSAFDVEARRKARAHAARRAEVRDRFIVGAVIVTAIFLIFLVYGHTIFSLMPLPDVQ